ncbi:hypothetical protein HanPI659440_Chr00c08g0719871 [Helianthus annuus]|nr:hypothetical protein HanPI659440_Chr00c08g0719871 [Helianthus annuus]
MSVPGQSHVKAMLKLAELLHYKGLQITFVNTDSVHMSVFESGGPHFLDGSPGFLLETIPDGVPHGPEFKSTPSRVPLLLQSIETNFLGRFSDLVTKLQDPPCIISDGFMSVFTIDAAQKLGIPVMMYWTLAACGYMGFYQIQSLFEKGLAPLKEESYITNGYFNTIIDWVSGMKGIRLKDFPVDWTADINDKLLKFTKEAPKGLIEFLIIFSTRSVSWRLVSSKLCHRCMLMFTPSAQCNYFLIRYLKRKSKLEVQVMDTAYGKKSQSVSSGFNLRSQIL